MKLDEILHDFAWSKFNQREADKTIAQAHSDILQWIKETMPPDGNHIEYYYRQQAFKSLGIG